MLRRISPALALLAAGVLVSMLDAAYAASAGEVLSLGPFRPAWLAAMLVLGGVGLLVYRVLVQAD